MKLNEISEESPWGGGGEEWVLWFGVEPTEEFTLKDANEFADELSIHAMSKVSYPHDEHGESYHEEGFPVSYNIRFDHPGYYNQAVKAFRRRLRGKPKIEVTDWEHYKV